MNELLQIRLRDNTTGKTYNLVGFSSVGDDRAGWNVNDIVLYDVDKRNVFRVSNPMEIKRLSILKE